MSADPARPLRDHPVFAPGILSGFHLLEADAGTGKTWTISGLVARALIETELTIDRILVVTFTRAATAELSRRIRERIEQLATLIDDRLAGRDSAIDDAFCVACVDGLADPKPALDRLRIALAQIDEAQVRTIHGFCHRVIDEHALSIGVAQGLKAQALGGEWIERGIAGWWREAVLDAPVEVLELLRDLEISPAALAVPVRAIDARPTARIVPAGGDWRDLASQVAALRARLADAVARDADALREWIGVKGQVDGRRIQWRYAEGWLRMLAAFGAGQAGFAATLAKVGGKLTADHFRGPESRFAVPPLELVGACEALEQIGASIATVPAMVAIEVAAHVGERRLALKADAGVIDHDDLLRIVRDALVRTPGGDALAASVRERHPIALIDECQDTDALQWEIFREIYRPESPPAGSALILVGDPKQAIYAFRAADVYSYIDARGADPTVHGLHENQRSVRALIEAVNALFGRDDPFLVPEIGFAPSREGAKPRKRFEDAGAGETRAPMTVIAFDGGGENAMLRKPAAQELATRVCVAEIARLLAPGQARIDGRALAPGDIAVLVNSHAEGTRIKRALSAGGIGAAEISRDSVLASRECDELIRIIAAIAEPADAQLMKSALATALLDLRAQALGDADASASVLLLAQARQTWADAGPQAALRRLFSALGAWPRLARLRDGERRLTNLNHLFELLAAAEQPREGARPALRWLMRMRDEPQALGEDVGELRLDSDDDLVRIVTVHKSKGLEYPIVFVPFAWSGRQFSGRTPKGGRTRASAALTPLAYHRREDRWTAVLDFVADPKSAEWAQAARETHAEALRALYVALTRAEQRCYLLWGPGTSAQFAPLAWLLHDLDPAAQKSWDSGSKEPPAIDDTVVAGGLARWARQAAERCPGSVAIVAHEQIERERSARDQAAAATGETRGGLARDSSAGPARDPTYNPTKNPTQLASPPSLAARIFDTRIPQPWIRTSFTALAGLLESAHGTAPAVAHVRDERPDHEQSSTTSEFDGDDDVGGDGDEGVDDIDRDPDRDDPANIRFVFPAGAQAGTCLHGILESADFARPVEAALVARWLARSGFDRVDPVAVAGWLDAVLDTPLPDLGAGSPRLRALAPSAIVREMEFQIAGEGVDDARVIDAIAAEHPIQAAMAGGRWSGFLRGFIDLLFEADGRYYLLDWKSNRLGARWRDYEAAPVDAAIGANAYALQYSLYSLALHRLLRSRLPGYTHAAHFGGVYYLFIRGVAPNRADRSGRALGIHAVRPREEFLERLDALFGGRS